MRPNTVFHEMTSQGPFEVWLAIDLRKRKPRVEHPPLRIVRFSGEALTRGIGMHDIEGVSVSVTSPARTVADCFLYRNKIGLDVALEALREVLRDRKCSTDELWKYAKICRVTKTIRPYMEATL